MYTGTVISELMEMVVRVEGSAQDMHVAGERESEDQLLASHFAYSTVDTQPLMVGVA